MDESMNRAARGSRKHVLAKIEKVIALFNHLPRSEAAMGWDQPRIENWLPIFEKMRASLLSPEPLPDEYASFVIVRGLDFDGITAGEIFDLSLEIGHELRELATQSREADSQ